MGTDRHYVPGDFYRVDDRTGFSTRAKRTRKEWNNLIVDQDRWEPRQPQDFVKGVVDDQTVPDPRPRQTDVFLGPLFTTLTANAANGATSLTVASAARVLNGDKVLVMLDNGVNFSTSVGVVTSLTSFTISPSLPSVASIGAVVEDITAQAPALIG